ncbi:hypothetical protein ACU5P1_11225 [Pseudomonas plecoglossicida]|uniref:hypothetical protein n=1 Tax=Pseudomonas plecoglossicida TaxID=70775 RepID=UPI001182B7CE|nr:hypothetical protein [Pseudomonas plecoglossicida]QLB55350.1 hypothetical protein HAV28_11140 [Pseudomonas plecoglossicida]
MKQSQAFTAALPARRRVPQHWAKSPIAISFDKYEFPSDTLPSALLLKSSQHKNAGNPDDPMNTVRRFNTATITTSTYVKPTNFDSHNLQTMSPPATCLS